LQASSGSFTEAVNKAPLTISAKDASKTYGEGVTFGGTEFMSSGLVNGDTVSSVTLTSSGAAGTATVSGSPYAITPSAPVGTGLGNYTISYANGKLTITPAPLTVRADDKSKIYGQANPALTDHYAGFVLGQDPSVLNGTLTFNTQATTSSNVGSYPITPTGLTSSNYAITFASGTLTIAPAPLTITADNKAKVYGAAMPVLTASFTGFVNGDTSASLATQPALNTIATASSHVLGSPYSITASGAQASNYTITLPTCSGACSWISLR
jgi:hypothetical protein